MTEPPYSLVTAEQHFKWLVQDWARSDDECRRLYVLWQQTCQNRKRLAEMKNAAFRKLQEVRCATDAKQNKKTPVRGLAA